MGIIDSTNHIFRCSNCNSIEEIRIVERGSSYGASWADAPNLQKFDVRWTLNQFGEPTPILAKCAACEADASHEVKK